VRNGFILAFLAGIALTIPAYGQRKVAPQNLYHRVWAVVPMTGSGTEADPRRPLYAPAPAALSQMAARQGIVSFTSTLSDDGKFALVEFAAVDRAALLPILTDARQDVKKFEKGKATEADVLKEFRKYKKDFDLRTFGAGLQ
jgi:hypothetical protein